MTDKLNALITLRDKVKAGDTPNQDEFRAVFGWHTDGRHQLAAIACEASDLRAMGAALALKDAVLPGWAWSVKTLATDNVQAWTDSAYGLRQMGYIGTTRDNPARALLLAILEALIAMEKQHD